ncbi:MAG: histidinol-phosphate transaminase [Verrucomicrobiae bacterium]|nr:histidinol-phosphate transaminase [Verrucomicrobiae bacterium]
MQLQNARLPCPNRLIRPLIRRLQPYVPGEQPKVEGLIKLNTNENPYPPAPSVLRAIRSAADARLRLYPNPTADGLRYKLAKLYGCAPENIIVGNGSDELLEMAVRCFVEPSPCASARTPAGAARCMVQYLTPSYSLYPVLADMHGAIKNAVPLNPDFSLPSPQQLRRGSRWRFDAALTFITTPNAPSGRGYRTAELESLCRAQRGLVVLDEAYAEFADENALALALKYPHVIVSRTFSKAYSLCFLRVGYFIGHPELIAALHKIRDSYNVNGLGQLAAETTLDHLDYYSANFGKIRATRQWLTEQLTQLGFHVVPSQTNFIFVRPPDRTAHQRGGPNKAARTSGSAEDWYYALRERKILVRWFDQPQVRDYLRITIGTPSQARRLVQVVREILGC